MSGGLTQCQQLRPSSWRLAVGMSERVSEWWFNAVSATEGIFMAAGSRNE